ncbi:MAG: hypothetical protein OER88_04985, partial [Planctomycetota bacterium]|nr:hypothetical protein [Planctomycetota bacterium]
VGSVRLKIAAELEKVWCGLDLAGKEIDVKFPVFGAAGAAHFFKTHQRRPVLVVVTKLRGQPYVVAGIRHPKQPGYVLEGFFDFNAVMFFDRKNARNPHVLPGELDLTFRRRPDFVRRVVRQLLPDPPDLTENALRRWLDALGDNDPRLRKRALEALEPEVPRILPLLRRVRTQASDPEVTGSIHAMLARHKLDVFAHDIAQNARKDPREEAGWLLDAHPHLEGNRAARALARLTELLAKAQPGAEAKTEAGVLGAWRTLLGRK